MLLFLDRPIAALAFLASLPEFPHGDVEDWRQEQAEECDAEHAGEHGNAHDMPHFGAGAGCDDKWNDTGDECE